MEKLINLESNTDTNEICPLVVCLHFAEGWPGMFFGAQWDDKFLNEKAGYSFTQMRFTKNVQLLFKWQLDLINNSIKKTTEEKITVTKESWEGEYANRFSNDDLPF